MELLDIYNSSHQPTGRTISRGQKPPDGECLLVVHVCVLNSRNELLIQRRQMTKDRYPGCWDLSAGGFVHSGEDSPSAVLRELQEELGLQLTPDALQFLFTEPFSFVLDDFYLARADVPVSALHLQEEEVSEAVWAGEEEVLSMIRDGSFVDYAESGIRDVFRLASAIS